MDLPLAAPNSAPTSPAALPLAAAAGVPTAAERPHRGDVNPDFDLGTAFDVPAFLRRQEG
jgi:hypothetical protein